MPTAYRPADAGGFSRFELLAANPQVLSEFACHCATEDSGENLLAYLLLQYIDCRATAGRDVSDEFNILYRDFIREGCSLDLNISSQVRKRVVGCLYEIPNREYRSALSFELEGNLCDPWDRFVALKPQLETGFPKDFRTPSAIPGIDIWKAYLEVRRIFGKGPHPAGPNRAQRFVSKLRRRLGH